MRKALKILGIVATVVVAVLAVMVMVVGTVQSYIDRGHQRDDFRDDVVAMGFTLLPAPEGELNPNWNNVQHGSKLQAQVIVGCWVVELRRQEAEKRLLTSAQGRAIEVMTLREVHLRPRFLERNEVSIEDFTDALTPQNVVKYMRERKNAYPCRTDLHLG